jgi:hypothetical protein
MGQGGMHQRPTRVAGSGVHDHARRLVHHQQVVVFEDDIQWDRFWDQDARLGGRQAYLHYGLSLEHLTRLARHRAIDQDKTILDQILDS